MRILAWLALLGVLAAGCSSGAAPCSPDMTSDSANCGACGKVCPADEGCFLSACVSHREPPPDPGGPSPDGMGTRAFAIMKIFLGDTDWNDTSSPDAWKAFGFDIDGLFTTASSTNVCALGAHSAKLEQLDGNGGIDNSWGANVLPLYLTTAGQDFAVKINQAILGGGPTTIFTVDDLGNARSASPMHASIVSTAPFAASKWALAGSRPKWDGSDVWPIDVATLNGLELATAKLDFPESYLNGGVFVAALRSNAGVLSLGTWEGKFPFYLPVTKLMVSMTIAPDGKTARGVLSAVIPVEAYLPYVKIQALTLSCSLSGDLDFVGTMIGGAADILSDGTNEPGRPCDAISLGLGFEAEEVQLGGVVSLPTLPVPCQR